MTSHPIPGSLRKQVIDRASRRCEYCLMPQDLSAYSHEIDHILAIKHGGKTETSNLALACLFCNRYKGADFATIDLASGRIVPLFHPRRQVWKEHFQLSSARIAGITDIGKATARLLKFNESKRLRDRQILMRQGLYP